MNLGSFKQWLLGRPDMPEKLFEFGGEECPYSQLRENTDEENALAEGESVVFCASPDHQTYSCYRKSAHLAVSARDKARLQVKITKIGDQYFWKSRKCVKLAYSLNGSFHYFTAYSGAYVKIKESNGKFIYLEHFSQSMITFTFWGAADSFTLNPK